MPAQVKKCSKCKKNKSVDEFVKSKSNKDGLQYECKRCQAKYWDKYQNKPGVKRKKSRLSGVFRDNQKANPEFVNTPQRWYFNAIKRSAKRRGHKFNLTYDEFIKSFNGGICTLSGAIIYFTRTENQAPGNQSASLDRINSAQPYQVNNIQWVHKNINLMKNHFSQGKFIQMCKEVVSYNS